MSSQFPLARNNVETGGVGHRLLLRDSMGLEDQANEMQECDIAFFDCVAQDVCSSCFFEMTTNAIDWTGVTQNTECSSVVATLQKNKYCKSLTESNQDAFCKTFHSCVVFDNRSSGKNRTVDCDALTECKWEGMHSSFIGDGVCHESYFDSCYNTAICNYDGGDCCKDTCKSGTYLSCGSDGYACRDPKSAECDPTFSLNCPPSSYKKTADDKVAPIPVCQPDETIYRIVMFDSFGDGWEKTQMTVTDTTTSKTIFLGGLESGSEGSVYVCMSINPTCYNVKVSGGNWGREASWYIKGFSEGSPSIAAGGGAMDCTFPVVGSTSCQNTCNGKSNMDPTLDPNYKDLKKMNKCIDEKCMIPLSECNNDPKCFNCFVENVPDYCFNMNSFLAVNDCAMCKCQIDDPDMEGLADYCNSKQAPGVIIPTPKDGTPPAQPVPCTPAEVLGGTTALLEYSQCLAFDKTPIMMTDFDSNNFGPLDTFEACAHKFAGEKDHGGHTALECMQILVDAAHYDVTDVDSAVFISQLAAHLYADGIQFCDCAKTASTDAPLCPSFYNFKTLLYESIDACTALDEIDCDAWDEFQKPCQLNVKEKFGGIDFNKPEQCQFVATNCGTTYPFPSFRHLDCAKEIPQASWIFYLQYQDGCLEEVPPSPSPAPMESRVTPKTKPPTPYEPVKPGNIKPVVPTSYNGNAPSKPSYQSPDEKKKSHWFRNTVFILLALGVGYYFYKRQTDGFSFVRYRRMTNFNSSNNGFGGAFGMMDDGGVGGDMYSGLSLESSMTFEPPSLPPTPMSMPTHTGGYGA